jgi:RNA polymerase sigma-70 factor, ECF subfamily
MAMGEGKRKREAAPRGPALRVVARDEAPDYAAYSDEDLMLSYAKGHETAFAHLVERHQRGVLNFVYRMVQSRSIAEEISQEVFLALVKNAKRYKPTAKFTTYLYTIASNMISKEWLKRRRRPKVFSLFSNWRGDAEDENFHPLDQIGDENQNVLDNLKNGEVAEAVNDALLQLPAHQREAFVLRRFQDLSYSEISEITRVPVGTAKSRVVRAERALRPLLEPYRDYV